ncbi:MAG: nucleotidyltransferase domain-containing protein [Tunicatimonas sp.]|uniref:nucleotidyltransferase domain-containing protein n=1 Tax=Tunicatimonas sp. TaxID=1940096 RepID=UPI003C77E814
MKFGLPNATYQLLQNYFRQQSAVEKVIIYGSRAMGTQEPASDIDLALVVNEDDATEAFFLIAQIKTELEELPTPYRFNVINLGTLKHDGLRDHIARVGKVFYEWDRKASLKK